MRATYPWKNLAGWVVVFYLAVLPAHAAPRCFGVLQGTLEHAAEGRRAGWNVAVISLAWDAFEPVAGQVDEGYVKQMAEKARIFRELGYRLQLDPGTQYPPGWIFDLPQARYRSQSGQLFESAEPGKHIPNYVFNRAVRERSAAYLEQIFQRLGTNWDWVRLGGGFYGEVNFPSHRFQDKDNCYWAFDDLAQGKAEGLAQGVKVCPVPGWIPGTPSPDHESARVFLDWYLGSLQNFHDWQIATVRQWYSGDLCLMYGSWGIRPGGIELALTNDLDGSSQPERVGELQSGYDWKRMIGGIRDPKVIVYCTWIDAPEKDCDDLGKNPSRWSPVHWQAWLAAENPLQLRVWGENTGRGDLAAMRLTFARAGEFQLMGVLWAFENELFSQSEPEPFASFEDLSGCIRQIKKTPSKGPQPMISLKQTSP